MGTVDRRGGCAPIGVDFNLKKTLWLNSFVSKKGGPHPRRSTPGFRLAPVKGVFREICARAEQARKRGGSAPFDVGERRVFKMSLGRAGSEDEAFDAAIAGGYVVMGWGGELDWSDPKFESFDAVKARWSEIEPGVSGNSGNVAQVFNFRGSIRKGDLVVVSYGNHAFRAVGEITGDYRYDPTGFRTYNHRRDVRWLLVLDEPLGVEEIYGKPFTQQSCYRLADDHLKREALSRLLPGEDIDEDLPPDQFVLVIDEINRANVSKVLGELITLLEPDKRLGTENEIRLTLPYSGDVFGVPDNLHIVGTMNTADRSIALLDTALRRRFAFRELMPDSELLAAAGDAPRRGPAPEHRRAARRLKADARPAAVVVPTPAAATVSH
jgi:5-methylcytosine-specific restriction protein B